MARRMDTITKVLKAPTAMWPKYLTDLTSDVRTIYKMPIEIVTGVQFDYSIVTLISIFGALNLLLGLQKFILIGFVLVYVALVIHYS